MRTIPLLLLATIVGCGGTDDTGKGDDTADTGDADQDGYTVDEGDCDDADATSYPGATEEGCDGIDQDCDGEDLVSGGTVGWADGDADGWGAAEVEYCGTTAPAGVVDQGGDCADEDAAIHPEADETCNEVDDDCDQEVDEEPVDGATYHQDYDEDGVGSDTATTVACAQPAGYVAKGGDCDDAVDTTYTGATELCDDVDNDCDGEVDDGVELYRWYRDDDGDGYGETATHLSDCAQPPGFVTESGDCDDGAATTYPGAREQCDGLDNDCDSDIDDGVPTTPWYIDVDSDGYGDASLHVDDCAQPPGYVENSDDCDDTTAEVSPAVAEVCNGIDDDCDGAVDLAATDVPTWYRDDDADGYGGAETQLDCEQPLGFVATTGDCDDGNAAANPGAAEACDGFDGDCDGATDEAGSVGETTFYADGDADGYGVTTDTWTACDRPDGYAPAPDDCDDAAASVNPAATEACNGWDDDCDGTTDEAGATGEIEWYADVDADTHGDPDASVVQCDAPTGWVDVADDCDDRVATTFGGAPELDNLVDDDCDGWVDEDYVTPGSVVISEIMRQPAFGGASTVAEGQWFEVYNPSATRTLDLANWYVIRSSSRDSHDAFFVDPADGVRIAPGGYAVFCKTTDYEGVEGVPYPLFCDYVWGDPAESSTYAGYYRDNTFNLQRDVDSLALYIGGGSTTGTLLDLVGWTYDATNGYWPRDRDRSTSLDPSLLDATANDVLTSWCSTAVDISWTWWMNETAYEYGTPGAENYHCY